MKVSQITNEELIARESPLNTIILSLSILAVGIIMLLAGSRIGIALLGIGVVLFLISSKREIIVSKKTQDITLKIKSLIIKRELKFNFIDIERILIQSMQVSSPDSQRMSTQSTLAVKLKDGSLKSLSLDIKRNRIFSFSNRKSQDLIDLGTKIAQFIGVPFEDTSSKQNKI